MTMRLLENVIGFTQRDNIYSHYNACFPTSAAIAMFYKHNIIVDGQLEDYIVKQCKELTQNEINNLPSWCFETKSNGEPQYDPWTCIPVMAYVCNKIAPPVKLSWAISFNDIIENIENDTPIVCLGDFSSMSRIGGHYNCIVGYDTKDKHVWVQDPFGNAYENYNAEGHSGNQIYYPWELFNRGNGNSYGLYF